MKSRNILNSTLLSPPFCKHRIPVTYSRECTQKENNLPDGADPVFLQKGGRSHSHSQKFPFEIFNPCLASKTTNEMSRLPPSAWIWHWWKPFYTSGSRGSPRDQMPFCCQLLNILGTFLQKGREIDRFTW